MKNEIKKFFKKIHAGGTGLLFQATTQFVPIAPMDASQGSKLSGLYAGGDLATYISKMFVFALSIGAIIAVVRLMWAGYLYMGGDNMGNMSKARQVFKDVIIGLLLLLSIWLILYKINPQLLNIQILTSIQNKPSTGQQVPAGTQAQGQMTCPGNCGAPNGWCDTTTGECIIPANN